MRFNRRRSDRPDSARGRLGSSLEALERRELLTGISGSGFPGLYTPTDLAVYNPISHQPSAFNVKGVLLHNPGTQNPLLSNEGKIVTGKDRAGDEYTITVHGPGVVIVTDTTPNDGILDDNIASIQLIGTDINRTYVTGTVVSSFRVQQPNIGTVEFNRLIDTDGVRSIILSGFSLGQTVAPATGGNNSNTGIFLTGGVRYLQFHDILAPVDTSNSDTGINIIIGDPTTPLTVQPTIKLDSIFNTVFDSTATTPPTTVTPQTTPTVSLIVNGQIKSLSFISTTSDTVPASQAFLFPTVSTTGRTSVQATGIGSLDVAGAATNFTASRSAVPFQNGFTGLSRLNRARFHGPTDAVGLDVNGPINTLQFDKGLGNPTGTFLGQISTGPGAPNSGTGTVTGPQVPATGYGLPADQTSYAANGLLGGQVTSTRIKRLKVGPANTVLQTPTNPDFVQLTRQGEPFYIPTPGTALTNALIVSSGNIGPTQITGNLQNSEVKSGFHYPSFAAGLEGTRAPSTLGRVKVNGNLINSVVSATYRPFMHFYGTPADTAGPGTIRGNSNSNLASTGGATPLVNFGAGYYARTKRGGYLPPPETPKRVNGVLVR